MERREFIVRKIVLAALIVLLAFSGFAGPAQTALAQDGSLRSCTLLYAVQPGDTLRSIAGKFGATLANLFSLNRVLGSSERVIPGLVLCISTNSDVTLPPNGEPNPQQPGISVLGLDVGRSVTVQGEDFAPYARYTVQMSAYGVPNASVYKVEDYSIPADGTFTRRFAIPSALAEAARIRIIFKDSSGGLSASTVFRNQVGGGPMANCSQFYTVQSGDTLSIIARRFGVTVQDLIELNDLIDINLIFPGQRLCIEADNGGQPPSGRDAALRIVEVNPGHSVTLHGFRFPPGRTFDVIMSRTGRTVGPDYNVGHFSIDADGNFVRTFPIPPAFHTEASLDIRLVATTGSLVVGITFRNVTDPGNVRSFPVPGGINLPAQPLSGKTAPLTIGAEVTLSLGAAGAYLPKSEYQTVTLAVSSFDPKLGGTKALSFVQPLLYVQVVGPGNAIQDLRPPVYVFFDITDDLRTKVDLSLLNIFFYDPVQRAWERCNSQSPVNAAGSGVPDRLACGIDNFGLYALAVQK